jgi:hypothetical protein
MGALATPCVAVLAGDQFASTDADAPLFHPVPAPESSDLQQLVEQIAGRIGRALERHGLVERDLENAWLATDTEAGPLDDLLGHSITYRIAVGPRAGQKLFTLQTVAPRLQGLEAEPNGVRRRRRCRGLIRSSRRRPGMWR